MSRLQIREDDLTGRKIAEFLREHLQDMNEITPPESVHALDLEALRKPDITFWTTHIPHFNLKHEEITVKIKARSQDN